MHLFPIRGGVEPDGRKSLSGERPIEPLPLPQRLYLPLQQHIGAPAEPVVTRGQRVAKGELIARAPGPVSAPVHAPTSGRVIRIGAYPANHPSGLPVRTITLEPDGEERWHAPLEAAADPLALPPEAIAARVAAAGVVGMGGATFPSAVKLGLGRRHQLSTLVINGSECEPYLTCDDRLMREQPAAVVEGARIMAQALGVAQVLIAIEDNKPQALTAMGQAAQGFAGIEVVPLPQRYPMGSEKHLVKTLTGRETPARALTAELGVVVHNAATAFAVHEAVRHGRPLIERVVTVSGGAIRRPANLRVPLGTPVQALIDHCGGFATEPARLIGGGPMMGQPLPETRVPVLKGSNGVLALTADEVGCAAPGPCLRCGSCVSACPCGLVPLAIAARVRAGDLTGARDHGLSDCVGCGSCTYVCPSHQPLNQLFAHARGELAARDRTQRKQAETKRLAEQRAQRIEAQKRAKREAMARRKREAAAKQDAAPAAEADGG